MGVGVGGGGRGQATDRRPAGRWQATVSVGQAAVGVKGKSRKSNWRNEDEKIRKKKRI